MRKNKSGTYAVLANVKDTIEHEYQITFKRTKDVVKYTMSYSDASFWSDGTRGSVIITCTDDGNKFNLKYAEDIKLKSLEYHHAEHLFVLLKFMKKIDDIKCKYKFKKIK